MYVAIDIIRDPEEAQELWDVKCVKRFLKAAVELTGLHAITKRQVIEHLEGGLLHIDGHVMIAESHIHVTVVPERGRGWADVFSCKEVNINLLTVVAAESFGGNQFIRPIPRMELTEATQ